MVVALNNHWGTGCLFVVLSTSRLISQGLRGKLWLTAIQQNRRLEDKFQFDKATLAWDIYPWEYRGPYRKEKHVFFVFLLFWMKTLPAGYTLLLRSLLWEDMLIFFTFLEYEYFLASIFIKIENVRLTFFILILEKIFFCLLCLNLSHPIYLFF